MWLNVSQYGHSSHGSVRDEKSEAAVAGTPCLKVELNALMTADRPESLIEWYRSGLERYEVR